MNVNIPKDAIGWLFGERSADTCCMWSFGRHRPPVELGEDLIFRAPGGVLLGRAIVRAVYQPGELDMIKRDGDRKLTGWKTLWYQTDFEDLRFLNMLKSFGKPLTNRMTQILDDHDENGRISAGWLPSQVEPLVERGLAERCPQPQCIYRLTAEGWRAVLRAISPRRVRDLRHTDKASGGPVCHICGCTDFHGCAGGCSWVYHSVVRADVCSRCVALIERTRQTEIPG